MKNSKEIKTEIEKIESRLTELGEMETKQSAFIEAAEESYTNGAGVFDDLHEAQGKLETLKATINSLETKKRGLQRDFDEAFAHETKENIFGELAEIAGKVGGEVEKYDRIWLEFNGLIAEYTAKLFSQSGVIQNHQNEFADAFDKLKTDISNVHHVDYKKRPILENIKAEVIKRGASKTDVNAATRESVKLSEIEFGGIIETALNIPRRASAQSYADEQRAQRDRIREMSQKENAAAREREAARLRDQENERTGRQAERDAEIEAYREQRRIDLGLNKIN